MFSLSHTPGKGDYRDVVTQMVANWRALQQVNPDAPSFVMWRLALGYPTPGESPLFYTLSKRVPADDADSILKGYDCVPFNGKVYLPIHRLLMWELATVRKRPGYKKLSTLDWSGKELPPRSDDEDNLYCGIILLPDTVMMSLVQVYYTNPLTGNYCPMLPEPLLYKG